MLEQLLPDFAIKILSIKLFQLCFLAPVFTAFFNQLFYSPKRQKTPKGN